MSTAIQQFNKHKVLYLNIIFTLVSLFMPLAFGFKIIWYSLWILIPIFTSCHVGTNCLIYMSLYMRTMHNVQLFSLLIFISSTIILFKQIFNLYKNNKIINYLKIFLFYLVLIVFTLFYSILINNIVLIYYVYYLNMINLFFIFYLIKNELNSKIIIDYSYSIIVSCVLSIVAYCAGLYQFAFYGGLRFQAFMPLCNTLGVNCIICICALYVLTVNNLISKKHSYCLIAVLAMIGIATLSKSFLISACITGAVIVVREFAASRNKKRFIKYGIFALTASSPILIHYGLIMWARLFEQASSTSLIESITTGRVDKWWIYLKPYIKSGWKILFGLGFGFDFNTIYSSHSFYVGYLCKMGVVGLIALIVFTIKILYAYKPQLKLYCFPIITIALVGIVEDLSYNTFNFIPVIIASVTFYLQNKNKTIK